MTQHKDRKAKIRARMAATGEPYTEAAHHVGEAAGPPLAADSTGEHLAWSGPDGTPSRRNRRRARASGWGTAGTSGTTGRPAAGGRHGRSASTPGWPPS